MRLCFFSIVLALLAGCATSSALPVGPVADAGEGPLGASTARVELEGHQALVAVEVEVRRLGGTPTAVVSTHTLDGDRHTAVLAPAAAVELLAVVDLSTSATLDLHTAPGARPVETAHHVALVLRTEGADEEASRLWLVDFEPEVAVVLDLAMVTGPRPRPIKKTTKKLAPRRTLRTLTLTADASGDRASLQVTACTIDAPTDPDCDTRELVYTDETAHYQLRRDDILIY